MRTQSVASGYVVRPGSGDLLASARATGGSLTVMRLAVDGGPPRHVHEHEDESLYLFTGELEVECGGETFTAAPGCFVFMPRRVPHAFRSIGGPVTGLLIATPGGIDEYFAALHAATRADADPGEVEQVMGAYGISRA
jgi:mannose-6-phosphate isomerase-like protein (cupin superfamily)